jgi:hypothetical protein
MLKLRSKKKSRKGKTKIVRKSTQSIAKIVKPPTFGKFLKSGIVQNFSHSFSASTDFGVSALFMHSTNPVWRMRFVLAAAIVRKAAKTWGWKISDWNGRPDVTGQYVYDGSPTSQGITNDIYNVIRLKYRYAEYSNGPGVIAPVNDYVDITYDGGRYIDFAYKVMHTLFYKVIFLGNGVGQNKTEHFELMEMLCLQKIPVDYIWTDNGTDFNNLKMVSYDMIDSTIEVAVKSTLKFQNRSRTNSDDNESNDIDLVPVLGKYYEGSGASIAMKANLDQWNNKEDPEFKCDAVNGINFTTFVSSESSMDSVTNTFNRPPPAKIVRRVQKSGAVALEPGEIDNSVLYFNKTIKVNKFLQQYCALEVKFQYTLWNGDAQDTEYDPSFTTYNAPVPPGVTPILHYWSPLGLWAAGDRYKNGQYRYRDADTVTGMPSHSAGKYRAFWVEKQITIGVTAVNDITISGEHNYQVGAMLHFKKSDISNPHTFRK